MRINKLPINQVKALENAFKKSKNSREKIRYQALWLSTQRYKRPEVAKIIGKSEGSIRRWISQYNKKDIEGLREKPQPGNHRKLTIKQKDELKSTIKKKAPYQLGLKTKSRFWNIPRLRDFVKDFFSVEYQSERSYHRLFHYCGFSFHKPIGKDKRQNPKKVANFEKELREELRQIKQEEKGGYSGSFWLPTRQDLNMKLA